MIIIKTSNGDSFVNEAEMLQVNHLKDKAQVEVWPSRWGNQPQQPQFYVIEKVEKVIYTNKETEWTDEGSEIKRLKKALNEELDWGGKMRDEYRKIDNERYELKAKVGNLQMELNKLKGATEELKPTEAPTNPETKITLRAAGPMGSDCTQAYDVDGCDGMTVGDFIQYVIKNDQYVDIDIMRKGKHIWSGEYTKQVLQKIDAHIKPLSEEQLLLVVKSARAGGGWGRMSYNVKLY